MPQYYSQLGPLSHASLTTLISLPTLTVQLTLYYFINQRRSYSFVIKKQIYILLYEFCIHA